MSSNDFELTEEWILLGTAPLIVSLKSDKAAIVSPGAAPAAGTTEGTTLTRDSVNPWTWTKTEEVYGRALKGEATLNVSL